MKLKGNGEREKGNKKLQLFSLKPTAYTYLGKCILNQNQTIFSPRGKEIFLWKHKQQQKKKYKRDINQILLFCVGSHRQWSELEIFRPSASPKRLSRIRKKRIRSFSFHFLPSCLKQPADATANFFEITKNQSVNKINMLLVGAVVILLKNYLKAVFLF